MARLVIALALAASAAALTQEEAQCVASFNGGQTFVMSGDSNMRYEFLALNEFVEKAARPLRESRGAPAERRHGLRFSHRRLFGVRRRRGDCGGGLRRGVGERALQRRECVVAEERRQVRIGAAGGCSAGDGYVDAREPCRAAAGEGRVDSRGPPRATQGGGAAGGAGLTGH